MLTDKDFPPVRSQQAVACLFSTTFHQCLEQAWSADLLGIVREGHHYYTQSSWEKGELSSLLLLRFTVSSLSLPLPLSTSLPCWES